MSINKFQEIFPLEEKLLSFMQMKVNQLNPTKSIETDPIRNGFLKKISYKLRDEFLDGSRELVSKRRAQLEKTFLQEVMDQKKHMRELGYAYVPTQP